MCNIQKYVICEFVYVVHRQYSFAVLIPLHRVASQVSADEDYAFLERLSEDYFCPVMMGLLVQPHLTSCCGKHLSEESATRIQGEGKPCPLCKSTEWSSVLNKHLRREVYELQVYCWYKERGCQWKGELSYLHKHTQSCQFRYCKTSISLM